MGLGATKPAGLGSPPITPERFGAIGDGLTNDTAAFAAMTDYINRHGGGEIALSRKTYLVGRQTTPRKSDYAFFPDNIMSFAGCTKPLVIHGNGARLRCADGLRFGTFDPLTGEPTQHTMPYYGTKELASPYFAMIRVANCSGQVIISDLELDGNVSGLKIGGPWGDAGWQIGCDGLSLTNNRCPILITNVVSHHHAEDGGRGDGLGVLGNPEYVTIQDCNFFSNGRNAWSMVGGVSWTFTRCKFDCSARSLPFPGSAPKAGIDFEAEGGKSVSDIHLVDCSAADNVGVACLHPGSSRVSDVLWEGGQLVGTTNYSFFGGGNEGIRFSNVLFLGALVNLVKEAFESCTFSNDEAQSPRGSLYNPHGFILPDCVATNRFTRCAVIHTKPEWSLNGNFNASRFEDCVFESRGGAGRLDVYGHFSGGGTQFVARGGGTNFGVTPGAQGGWTNAGAADDPFALTQTNGQTTMYPATS